MSIGIYPNLSAEQARFGRTDRETARLIGVHPRTYARKKQYGGFKENEISELCKLFGSTYEYLFETNRR